MLDLRVNNSQDFKDIILSITAASEFEEMKSKFDERKVLNALKIHEKMKFKLKETINSSEKKFFILLNASLANINLNEMDSIGNTYGVSKQIDTM